MLGYSLYDKVELVDGTIGYLIESFDDGAYLFEYEAPEDADPYDQRFISPDEIRRIAV